MDTCHISIRSLPRLAATLVSVVVVWSFASYADTATLSGNTSVMSFGNDTLEATPIDVSSLAGKAVIQISAGNAHSLLLTSDGTVYAHGFNGDGRTGIGITSENTSSPIPINAASFGSRTVKQVSGGFAHSLILTNDGAVYSFGDNSVGQLGLGTIGGNSSTAVPIDTSNLGGKTIRQVSAGFTHSLLLADDGTVFSFGWNQHSQTGLGIDDLTSTVVATPIITTNLGGRKINQVAAGGDHSLLVADDGTVFSFGWNVNAQTGQGTNVGSTLVAEPIDSSNLLGKRIKEVSANWVHNLLLAEDGTVYSFGWNNNFVTGVGPNTGGIFVATPIQTSNLGGKQIIQVAAGQWHSLLLASDGTVFSFGDNRQGRTGRGFTSGSTIYATPISMTNLIGKHVIAISAGDHSLVLAVPEPSCHLLLVCSFFAARRRCAGQARGSLRIEQLGLASKLSARQQRQE